MTKRKPRYDFWHDGKRYVSHGYPTAKERDEAEAAKRKELRAIRDGRELDQSNSPFIHDFAEVYFDWAVRKGKVKGPTIVNGEEKPSPAWWPIEMSLRFFGRRPEEPRPINPYDTRGFKNPQPYHDATLADVLRDPSWVTRFESYMDERGICGRTKNKYRSAMSQIFNHAMSPEWRNKTGVTRNPFVGIWRDPGVKRYTTFDTADALVKVIAASAPHQKLAIAVALYCPKFRHGSICRIDIHKQADSTAWIDDDMEFLHDIQHKTFYKTHKPLVAPVPVQLRKLIQTAIRQQEARHLRLVTRYTRDGDTTRLKTLRAGCSRLIQWEGKPVASLKSGFRAACKRADVPYGMKKGVTFHSLKHEGGTEAAQLVGISDPDLQALLGHETNAANQVYRHMKPVHEIRPSNALAKRTEQKLKSGAHGAHLFTRVG